jgi:acetyltransferase-like isoleucine patch superfamily enzyme
VNDILMRINSFFLKKYGLYRNIKTLKRLRIENPSCMIHSASLSDVSIGEYVAILNDVFLSQVKISDFSYISYHGRVNNADIGKFCSIGPYVQIGLAPHPSRVFVSTYPAFYSGQNLGCPLAFRENQIFDDSVPKTTLGNDIWIGANAIIPGGINLNTGAVVAAGAVVVKDVPPYAVVGGNPAKIIRYRFSDEQIDFLLASEWWNWPIEKIRQQVGEFSDIEIFWGHNIARAIEIS